MTVPGIHVCGGCGDADIVRKMNDNVSRLSLVNMQIM